MIEAAEDEAPEVHGEADLAPEGARALAAVISDAADRLETILGE